MLLLSVLNVGERCADLLPHRLGVIQSRHHQVLAHVEYALDWRDYASCSSSEHLKNLKRNKLMRKYFLKSLVAQTYSAFVQSFLDLEHVDGSLGDFELSPFACQMEN